MKDKQEYIETYREVIGNYNLTPYIKSRFQEALEILESFDDQFLIDNERNFIEDIKLMRIIMRNGERIKP